MTKETEKVLKMFSDVFEVNLLDEEDVNFNMTCGSVHSSKESAENGCNKWNRLAKIMGWKKRYKVEKLGNSPYFYLVEV